MLYSGADLIRMSGSHSERLSRMGPQVAAISSTESSQFSLDQETESGLLRFAKFINKEGRKDQNRPSAKDLTKKLSQKGIHPAYLTHIQVFNGTHSRGLTLNIFV